MAYENVVSDVFVSLKRPITIWYKINIEIFVDINNVNSCILIIKSIVYIVKFD